MVLTGKRLREKVKNGLVQDYIDLETQLTPNGFDFTVREIHRYKGRGKIDFSNSEREIPDTEKLEPAKQDKEDSYGWWDLESGVYKIVTNEIVDIPEDIVGFAYPRSSLLRMGATIENGVWDAGFKGRSSFMLVVENPEGVKVKENSRVNHIVFFETEEVEEGYQGVYSEK